MITSLKNNNRLLRKHVSIFKRRNEFSDLRKAYRTSDGKSAPRTKLTDQELADRRAQAILVMRREAYRRWIKSGIVLLILGFVVFAVYQNYQLDVSYREKHPGIELKRPVTVSDPAVLQAEYENNMAEGIRLLQQNRWFYASGYFEAAIKIKPGDETAEYNLALCYCLLCYNDHKACSRAEQIVDGLLTRYPNDARYSVLQSRYLVTQK